MAHPISASSKRDVFLLFLPRSDEGGTILSDLPYMFLYLERALRGLGLEIIFLDESRHPDYLPVLLEKRDRVLLAGVSAMTGFQIASGIAFSKKVREVCRAPVVWGGWHPTLLPEQTLEASCVDFVVVGQGERPLRQLVARLLRGQDASDIPGLGYKRGAAVTVNPALPMLPPSAFPPINLGLLDLDEYVYEPPPAKRCLAYFTSHGCPFHCAFCSVALVYERRWYHQPIPQIIHDLRFLKEQADIDSVSFEDDNFFVDKRFCRELATAMIEARLDLKWRCAAHSRLFTEKFDDDDMELFARSGCFQIYIGAESGDQKVLDALDKRSTVQHTFDFVRALKRHGIIPRLSTMVCLPMDPARDFDLTLDMVGHAKLEDRDLQASIWFYTPYPGTELFEAAKQRGFVPPTRLEDWSRHTLTDFRAPWAPAGCRDRLENFREFYFRMLDGEDYRNRRSLFGRAIAFPFNKLFHAMARLRLQALWFDFPVEARLFLGLRQCYRWLRPEVRARRATPAAAAQLGHAFQREGGQSPCAARPPTSSSGRWAQSHPGP